MLPKFVLEFSEGLRNCRFFVTSAGERAGVGGSGGGVLGVGHWVLGSLLTECFLPLPSVPAP